MNNYISVEVFIENDISGDWGKEFPDEKNKTKVFCVRGADINDLNIGKIENLPVRYVKEASKDKFLEKGNIIIEISGGSPTQSTGRVAFLENIDREVVCSNFCRALKIKKEYSPKYVFYLLQNIYYSGVFFNFESKTSGIKNLLYNSAFENIKVPNRDYSSQQKIENVITVIDKKIQLLHQINDNLAELAKTIYDYWFVQFDFPDQNGKPYKTSGGKMVYNEVLKREIPEGWEVKKLGEILTIASGFPFDSNDYNEYGNYQIITIKNVQENYLSLSKADRISFIPSKMKSFCFLEIGDILISLTGNVGRLCFVNKQNLLLNQRVGKFLCDEKYKNYIYCLFNSNETKVRLEKIATGSSQKNLSPIDAVDSFSFIPKENILKKFNKKTNPIYKKNIENLQQIERLQSLRDWLLPMLMNGQVSVE